MGPGLNNIHSRTALPPRRLRADQQSLHPRRQHLRSRHRLPRQDCRVQGPPRAQARHKRLEKTLDDRTAPQRQVRPRDGGVEREEQHRGGGGLQADIRVPPGLLHPGAGHDALEAAARPAPARRVPLAVLPGRQAVPFRRIFRKPEPRNALLSGGRVPGLAARGGHGHRSHRPLRLHSAGGGQACVPVRRVHLQLPRQRPLRIRQRQKGLEGAKGHGPEALEKSLPAVGLV
mmetsp:Transcript_26284/g.46614  ORF Transcript_26284/g.46614 Transcript_26284/m.46614 type:complete len:231 (-) Transcript_26284:966-1658(-)